MPEGVVQILLDVAGEFSGRVHTDPAGVNRMIGYAMLFVDASIFGNLYGLALAYRTAHMLKIDEMAKKGKLVAGRITSQTKTAFGGAPQLLNKQNSDEYLRSTDYGQQFLHLRNTLPDVAGPSTVVVFSEFDD